MGRYHIFGMETIGLEKGLPQIFVGIFGALKYLSCGKYSLRSMIIRYNSWKYKKVHGSLNEVRRFTIGIQMETLCLLRGWWKAQRSFWSAISINWWKPQILYSSCPLGICLFTKEKSLKSRIFFIGLCAF